MIAAAWAVWQAIRLQVIVGAVAALVVAGGWSAYRVHRAFLAEARAAQLAAALQETRRLVKIAGEIDADALDADVATEEIRRAVDELLRRPVASGDSDPVCVDADLMRAIGRYK